MRRKEYLKKKFEYYEDMKKMRNIEHKALMKRLKLEIAFMESRARRELATELAEKLCFNIKEKESDKNEDPE